MLYSANDPYYALNFEWLHGKTIQNVVLTVIPSVGLVPTILFTDGTSADVMTDEEGNGAGCLHCFDKPERAVADSKPSGQRQCPASVARATGTPSCG